MSQNEETVTVKEASLRWKWRRRVALVAFSSVVIILFMTVLGYVDMSEENIMLVRTMLDSMIMIVLAWMGVAAVDDIAMKHLSTREDKTKNNGTQNPPPSNG